MQLDRTHVAVRPRGISEICDLSLLVVRQYFGALCFALAVGILPLAVLNGVLLSWLPIETEVDRFYDEDTFAGRLRYVWLMGVLIFLETPLAGVFATHYIGQAVFEKRPPWRQVFKDVFSIAHRWVWSLGILRGPVVAVVILVMLWQSGGDPAAETFLIIFLVTFAGAVRAFRPHTVEIMLLERCPMVSRDSKTLSVGKRSQLLHTPVSNECFSRFMAIGMVSIVMSLAIFFFFAFFRAVFFREWSYSVPVQILLVPAAMWIVAGFTIVIRFLCYLDNRIRLEGWDVELGMRAEAMRQFGDPTGERGRA